MPRIRSTIAGVDRFGIEREREPSGRLGEAVFQATALVAIAVGGTFASEHLDVVTVQATEGLHREQLLDRGVVQAHRSSPSREVRMRRMPSSVRDLTVPNGRPVRSAICDWERPSKYIKREHVSLVGREFVQRRSNDAALFGQADLLHDVLGVVGDIVDRLGDRILGAPTVGLLTADEVDGAVVDHAHEP